MQTRKAPYDTWFVAVSSFGALFVITELVMNHFGKSLCATEGCALTAQSARFGDVSIFGAGLAAFLLLGGLALFGRFSGKPGPGRFINFVLIIALACEGFLMGYLAFRLHTVCAFCVIVCCFMVLLALLRALSGERDVLAGFAVFAALFSIQYFILPAGVPVHLPADQRLILFYSRECRHCAEVIREFDERKIAVAHEEVSGFAGFLKNMGIDHVPTLLVNDPYQKVFLTGKDAILRYLSSCSPPAEPASGKRPSKKAAAPAGQGGFIPDILNQPSLLTAPSPSPSDAGMCKEEEICK